MKFPFLIIHVAAWTFPHIFIHHFYDFLNFLLIKINPINLINKNENREKKCYFLHEFKFCFLSFSCCPDGEIIGEAYFSSLQIAILFYNNQQESSYFLSSFFLIFSSFEAYKHKMLELIRRKKAKRSREEKKMYILKNSKSQKEHRKYFTWCYHIELVLLEGKLIKNEGRKWVWKCVW